MRLSDLQPDNQNANKGTAKGQKAIVNSIQRSGAGRSIVVDKNNRIIGGNKTTEAIAEVYDAEAEVIVIESEGEKLVVHRRNDLDLSDPDPNNPARQLAYADNMTSWASFDLDPEVVMADIEAGFDFEAIDISLPDLGEMLNDRDFGKDDNEGADTEPQIDKAEELRVKWGVTSGQLWQLGEHRLICGDCTDKDNYFLLFGNERADLGITSPPYAVGKEYEVDVTFDQHLALLRGLADRAIEIIKVGGFFFVNFGEIAPQSHSKPLTGSDRQCLYLISKDYWQIFHVERAMDLYAQRIWYKPFNRLQQPFWTYHTSIPHYQEWEHIWTWRLPGGDGDEVYDWNISSRAVWDTRKEATDDKPLTRHVAAFPVGIPERALKAHSEQGAIIWEPFNGSGTTLIACQNLSRKCRAIEIDPGYCAVTLQRWADHTGKTPELIATEATV